MLQGWNSDRYFRTETIRDGCPVYSLESYTLYWTIGIAGVFIFRQNGVWVLQRQDYASDIGINKYGETPQPHPMGIWSKGATVTVVD
jgi:hypothetical protein